MKQGEKKKKRFVSYLPAIISAVCTAVVIVTKKAIVTVPDDGSFHFNLITVNALFGGFLYTNYSLLIGILDNPQIKKAENTEIISKRNTHILHGIIYATVSVIAGLSFILLPQSTMWLIWAIKCLLVNTEIVFMAFLILYFLLSLIEMNNLVNGVSKTSKKKSDEEISEIKGLMQKPIKK
jgi:hypothetical protein